MMITSLNMNEALENLELDEMFIRAEKSKASLEEKTYELERERVDDDPNLKGSYWKFLNDRGMAASDRYFIYERILMYIAHFRMCIEALEKAGKPEKSGGTD